MTKRYYRPANRNHMRKPNNVLFPLALILSAFAMLYAASGRACDEVYLKVGAGYKFDETTEMTVDGVDSPVENWSPYSARIEIGKQSGRWTYGVSHHSQWLTGAPFNNIKEYHKTELFVDYKWSIWK